MFKSALKLGAFIWIGSSLTGCFLSKSDATSASSGGSTGSSGSGSSGSSGSGGSGGGGGSPSYGMSCYALDGSAYFIANGGGSGNNPIAYISSISGSTISAMSFGLFLQDPGNDENFSPIVGDITLNVYSCVSPGSAPSTGTLVGSATATYADEVGSTFALGYAGAGTQGDPTLFNFGSPITVPTSCAGGQYLLAIEFTGVTGFNDWKVAATETSASSSCFLNISPSATTASDTMGNSFAASITASE